MQSNSQAQGNREIVELPKRPKGQFFKRFKTVNLFSNNYKVDIRNLNQVYLYKVAFEPKLEENDRNKRNKIFYRGNTHISKYFHKPVYAGSTIYTTEKPEWGNTMTIPLTWGEKSWKLHVGYVKTLDFTVRSSNSDKEQLMFLNNLLSASMRKRGWIQIGKDKRFYDNARMRKCTIADVNLVPGYSATICRLQRGLFLKLDTHIKVMPNDSVLHYIADYIDRHRDQDKLLRREGIKETLKNKSIMANYGNGMHWRIEDVNFDKKAHEIYLENVEQTVKEYYESRYNLKMTDANQPLLEVKVKEKTVYVLPEHCLFTDTSLVFTDSRTIQQISKLTRKPVDQKVDEIQRFREELDFETSEIGTQSLDDKLGIKISKELFQVRANKLNPPKILLGDNKEIEQGRESNFALRSFPIYKSNVKINLAILHFETVDITPIKSLFETTSTTLKIGLTMEVFDRGFYSNKNFLNDIKEKLQRLTRKEKYNMYLIIYPDIAKNQYSTLKQICCQELGINTQFCTESILKKKQYQSAVTKVLLQMAAKIGNILWNPRLDQIQGRKFMIIGLNSGVEKKAGQTKKSIGYCASLDDEFTCFHTNTSSQQLNIKISEHLETIILDCFAAYRSHNKGSLPQEIIVIRDGVSQSQIKLVVEHQVQNSKEGIKLAIDKIEKETKKKIQTPIKLTYVVVDKRPNQRFYSRPDNGWSNPAGGSLIREDLVSENYDFYLIPQRVTEQSSAVPTYYQVLCNDSNLQQGVLQEIIYSQCFNYCNWSGVIKIPSICQYAKKYNQFVTTCMKNTTQPRTELMNTLFYI